MTYHSNIGTIFNQQASAVDKLTAPLVALGLLTEDDAETASQLIVFAREVEHAGRTYDDTLRVAASEAAARVVKSRDVNTLSKEAGKLIEAELAHRVGDRAYVLAVTEAHALALGRASETPGVLSQRLTALTAETADAFDELGSARTPADAISHGVVDAWKAVEELRDQYAAIRELVSALRQHRLIAEAKPSDRGHHWAFLKNVEPLPMTADPLARFAHDVIERRPYVPASSAEADAVFRSWEHELEAAA